MMPEPHEDFWRRSPGNRRMQTLTRREFMRVASAGAVLASGPRGGVAAKYDLVIKGGRVIDPSQRIDRVTDIAVSGGRIARLGSNIPIADAAEMIDAREKVVTAGLVDIHAHIDRVMPPAHCLSTGVTSLVDAGSRGADGVEEMVELANAAPNRVRILLNLSRRSV